MRSIFEPQRNPGAGSSLPRVEGDFDTSSTWLITITEQVHKTNNVRHRSYTDSIKYLCRGCKHYEYSTHLGNVLAVISDKKIGANGTGTGNWVYFEAEYYAFTDYYPFGMQMEARSYTRAGGYRFGFNGQEQDDEIKNQANSLAFRFRIYDARIGRFMSVDPLEAQYSHYSPYQFAGNKPIFTDDLEGLEERRRLCPYNRNQWSLAKILFKIRGKNLKQKGSRNKRHTRKNRVSKSHNVGGDIEDPEEVQDNRPEPNPASDSRTPTMPATPTPPPTPPCTNTQTTNIQQTTTNNGPPQVMNLNLNYIRGQAQFATPGDRTQVNQAAQQYQVANRPNLVVVNLPQITIPNGALPPGIPSGSNCTTVDNTTITTQTQTTVTIGMWTTLANHQWSQDLLNGRFGLVSQQLQAMGVPANDIRWGWFRYNLSTQQMGGSVNLTIIQIQTNTTTIINTRLTTTCIVPCQ